MTSSKGRAGFTLIELIIAVSLSTVVLLGVFSIMTTMVQTEVDATRKGSVTAWSLASINSMNMDIAGSSCVVQPPAAGSAGDSLVLCSNWSRQSSNGGPPNGGKIDPTQPNNVVYFCYDGSNIRRLYQANTNCPAAGAGAPACTAGSYGANNVVATGVYRDALGDAIFLWDSTTLGAIRVRFTVGNRNTGTVTAGNPGTSFANPQYMDFDTRVVMENWSPGN